MSISNKVFFIALYSLAIISAMFLFRPDLSCAGRLEMEPVPCVGEAGELPDDKKILKGRFSPKTRIERAIYDAIKSGMSVLDAAKLASGIDPITGDPLGDESDQFDSNVRLWAPGAEWSE